MNFSLEGLWTWFLDQIQIIFLAGIITVLAINAWKRSLVGVIITIAGGIIIGIFIYNPDMFEQLAQWASTKLKGS
ncbi:TcpD family membrane protein [Staphylococcus aureus]|uniref:TcpD family membrane protein n=1 Tax=Staphylococcus aureus TaxID=1280 RepID=UPI00288E9F7E|nr:TcpD family membrane protein [Staphylococcus aureus]MDT3073013.1 TcpD family membrane protein [Staphylococcus aureus]MDT3271587.1 TcpD family membrane protein [Staphylococcus aureus]